MATGEKLDRHLPDEYEYLYSTRKMRKADSSKIHFKASTVTELNNWLRIYQTKTSTTWRLARTYKPANGYTYKTDYRCQHNTLPRTETADKRKRSKNCDCPASLTLTLIRPTVSTRQQSEAVIKGFLGSCTFGSKHNHAVQCADALRFRDVSEEVKLKLRKLYEVGHSPSTAWEFLQCQLFDSLSDGEYAVKSADRSVLPDVDFCYRLYYKIFGMQYGERDGEKDRKHLLENIRQYNICCGMECAKVSDLHGEPIIALCTPVMQRIHQYLVSSSDLTFLDSSGCLDKHNHRVFLLMTNSPAGGLPLGVFVTTSESAEAIEAGLRLLRSLIAHPFHSEGAPKVVITDDCAAERAAVTRVFPQVKLLLCTFHVLQAVWRWLNTKEHNVVIDTKQHVMKVVKQMMYAKTETDVNSFYDIFSNDHQNQSQLVSYITKLHSRRTEWCLCFRDSTSRGINTNNHVEVGFRVLKEKIFHRLKAYNLTQLTDFLFHRWSEFYVRKLVDIANNRYRTYLFNSKAYPTPTEIQREQIMQLDDSSTYSVKGCSGKDYVVDMVSGLCTCEVGKTGAICKHQHACHQFFENEIPTILPKSSPKQRQQYMLMATGNTEMVDHTWFESLRSSNSQDKESKSVRPQPCNTNVGNIDVLETVSISAPSSTKEDELAELHQRISLFCTKLHECVQSTEMVEPIKRFLREAESAKTNSSMTHLLLSISKNPKPTGLQSPVKIPKIRGTRDSGYALRSSKAGRPSKRDLASTEHAYAAANKKPRKAPHYLSELVARAKK